MIYTLYGIHFQVLVKKIKKKSFNSIQIILICSSVLESSLKVLIKMRNTNKMQDNMIQISENINSNKSLFRIIN